MLHVNSFNGPSIGGLGDLMSDVKALQTALKKLDQATGNTGRYDPKESDGTVGIGTFKAVAHMLQKAGDHKDQIGAIAASVTHALLSKLSSGLGRVGGSVVKEVFDALSTVFAGIFDVGVSILDKKITDLIPYGDTILGSDWKITVADLIFRYPDWKEEIVDVIKSSASELAKATDLLKSVISLGSISPGGCPDGKVKLPDGSCVSPLIAKYRLTAVQTAGVKLTGKDGGAIPRGVPSNAQAGSSSTGKKSALPMVAIGAAAAAALYFLR